MKTIASLLFFFVLTLFSYSQTEALNKLDSNGKKDGKWILYYNTYWKVVKDSSKASYYSYTYYDHGTQLFTTATWGDKNGRLEDSLSGPQQNRKLKLLDGKYTWFDKNGKILSSHYFNKGEPVYTKQFYSSGKLYLYFDYLKKCEGQPYSWDLFVYDKDGKLKAESPVCKNNEGKWPVVR
ncbi:MAG: hypothetical protein ACXVPU_01745 [Bacteroidia bacterium]